MNPESVPPASQPEETPSVAENAPSPATEAKAAEVAESVVITPSTLAAFAASIDSPAGQISTGLPHTAPETSSDSAEQPLPVENSAGTENTPVIDDNKKLALQFSPEPDAIFQSSVTVGISCATPNAGIRYVLGEDSVDESSALYNPGEKILLTQTTVVSAQAFANGKQGPLLSGEFMVTKPVWKEVEPANQTDPAPHKLGEVLVCPDGWLSAAGSVRGKLHAHRGLWREDSFALANIEVTEGVWSITAVSDGAGSAPLSRVGSKLACAAAIESLRISLGQIESLSIDPEELKSADLPALRQALVESGIAGLDAIRAEAEAREKPVSAFAATLLILVRREWNGAQLCAALQVGDGSIALFDANGLTLLGEADHGQHSSETRFLTTSGIEGDLPVRVRFSIKKEALGFAVMSDGVSDDYFPEEKRLGEVFDAVLPLVNDEQTDAGEALIKWLGYEKKGSSDDRTLVIVWPRPSASEDSSSEPSLIQTEASDVKPETADGDAG